MKRNKVLVILVFLIVSLSTFLLCVVNLTPKKEITGNLFAIMLEEDDGTYYESDLEIFPIDYEYNSKKSYCVNGSQLIWNNDVKSVSIDTTGSEKCYLYFDKIYYEFSYTGAEQMFTVPSDGNYKIEVWGASGGRSGCLGNCSNGIRAGYVSGEVYLYSGQNLYVYVGESGSHANEAKEGTFNGGGGNSLGSGDSNSGTGGGATDIRLSGGQWDSAFSLPDRIMVAGGGAGYVAAGTTVAGTGGGLTGTTSTSTYNGGSASGGGSQTAGGTVSISYPGFTSVSGSWAKGATGGRSGGGGGYYGGAADYLVGGGGSSFISGHTGSVAVQSQSHPYPKSGCTTGTTNNECSVHYSYITFTNTVMIDGAGYNWTNVKGELVAMPSPTGGTYPLGTGHTGHGFAKITYIN